MFSDLSTQTSSQPPSYQLDILQTVRAEYSSTKNRKFFHVSGSWFISLIKLMVFLQYQLRQGREYVPASQYKNM